MKLEEGRGVEKQLKEAAVRIADSLQFILSELCTRRLKTGEEEMHRWTESRSTQKGIGNDALKGMCELFKEKLNMPGHAGNKYREWQTSRRIGGFNEACVIPMPTPKYIII